MCAIEAKRSNLPLLILSNIQAEAISAPVLNLTAFPQHELLPTINKIVLLPGPN